MKLHHYRLAVGAAVFLLVATMAIVGSVVNRASAATNLMVPNGDVQTQWAVPVGTSTTCAGGTHCDHVDDGATANNADYISTGTDGSGGEIEEFALTSPTLVDTASQVILNVRLRSIAIGGSAGDTVDVGLRVNGILLATTPITMTTTTTDYTITYNGNWSQSDVDSMQVYLNRTVVRNNGNQSSADDNVAVYNIGATLTYTEQVPTAYNQASYRWLANAQVLKDDAGWFDQNWNTRSLLTINNTQVTETLQNFPVRVSLTPSNFNYAKAKAAGADLRFTDSDGITPLNYEIESWNPGGTSEVWVKVPDITASANDTLYVYYNNPAAVDAQNPASVWSNGYVGVWHLKENPAAAQPQFYDSTNLGRNGYSNGGMTAGDSVAAKIGNGLRTDGVDDYMAADSVADHNLNESFNVQVYARLTAMPYSSPFPSIVGKGQAGTADGWVIYPNASTGDVRMKRNNFSYTYEGTGSFSTAYKNYSMNYTKAASTLDMYVNGAPTAQHTAVTFPTNNTTEPLRLGFRDEPLNGQFDELRISNVPRSAQWIKADYMSMENTYLSYGAEETYAAGTYSSQLPALAAQNTAANVTVGTPFRLRQRISIENTRINQSTTQFKLQYAERSGTCDTAFVGEVYSDFVNGSTTTPVQFFDNPSLATSANIGAVADDPTNGVRPKWYQTYQETNPFTNGQSSVAAGSDGIWDFALSSVSAGVGKTYCLRVVFSTGALLNTYSQIPQVTITAAVVGPTLDQQLRGGQSVLNGSKTPLNW